MGKNNLAYGIGINDSNYPVYIQKVINGKQERTWTCPYYASWRGMIRRCYDKKYHADYPTYIGCTVSSEWLLFSNFRAWMIAHDHIGAHLDKDILDIGNKVYGPETCVFLKPEVNTFLNDQKPSRGEWPIGVRKKIDTGRFEANCQNPFTRKQEHLGYFDAPEDAHEAWRARKHEHACRYADMQTDPRIAAALRSRYAKSEEM